MSLKKSYIINTAIFGTSTFINSLISYIIIVILSRTLGAQGLGNYSFIFSYSAMFFLFSDLGISTLTIKELAHDFSNADDYLSNVVVLKFLIILLTFFVYLAISFISHSSTEILLALIFVGIVQSISNFGSIFNAVLRVKNKGKTIAIATFVERMIVLTIGGLSLLILKSFDLFIMSFILSNLAMAGIYFYSAKKFFTIRLHFDLNFIKPLILRALPFVFINAFGFIYVQIDSIMLYFLKDAIVTGWYSSGYKLINLFNNIPGILLMFGFPSFSYLLSRDKKALKKLFNTIIRWSLIIYVPILAAISILSYRVLQIIYHFNSVESSYSLIILMFAELFIIISNLMGALIVSDKQKTFAYISGIGAAVDLLLNFILIPPFSLYGAGIATMTSYIVMQVFMTKYINKNLFKTEILKSIYKPIIGSIIMSIAIFFMLSINLIFIVPVAIIVYVISMLILGLNKEDKEFTSGIMKFIKNKLKNR